MTTLISIDTTPNPNSMKLNLSEAFLQSGTFTSTQCAGAPDVVKRLLKVEGVQSVYASASFITLNRHPRVDWDTLLQAARQVFGEGETEQPISHENYGQVQALVQTFRDIPIQVKVTDGKIEKRAGLPARFGELARELQGLFGADYLKERHWADYGIRYGNIEEVTQEVVEEIEQIFDENALNQRRNLLTSIAKSPTVTDSSVSPEIHKTPNELQERLRAIQELIASEETLPILLEALQDYRTQIRRWAAAKLAGVKVSQSVTALSQAVLNDANVGVRRTAGDSLSDIGDVAAQETMCKALSDPNKLVRWRAARFLAEVGTDAALSALEAAKNDSEYEVRFEVEAALQHIREGSKAALPVWKLMAQDASDLS